MTDTVDSPSPSYLRMTRRWKPIDSLLGGTQGMRDAGEEYLPRLEQEQAAEWEARRDMTVLHPGFELSVERLAARPFGKEPVINGYEQMSPRLQALADDPLGDGTSIGQLGRNLMLDGCYRGLSHLGTDMPIPAGVRTRADELAMQPRFLRIQPPQLFAFQTIGDATGRRVLSQIRFMEVGQESDGEFSSDEVERIRVWNAAVPGTQDGSWALWERNKDNSEWAEIQTQPWSFSGGMPVATAYFKRVGFMEARSPFEPNAWLNVAHWQSTSRQRWNLDFARTGILWLKGGNPDDLELVIGANRVNGLSDGMSSDAELMYVDAPTAALAAGALDLRNLEEQMRDNGLEPMRTSTGVATAAASYIDEAKVQTDIQGWARITEYQIEEGFRDAATWIGETLPEEFSVDIPDESLGLLREIDDVDQLVDIWKNGGLTDEVLAVELQRRGILSDEWSIEEILDDLEKLKAERADVAAMIGAAADDDEDDGGGDGAPESNGAATAERVGAA